MMSINALTVTEVNRIIKYKLKEIEPFRNISVIGEITNFNERTRFGHWYFDLKDKNGRLNCNLFMNQQKNVKFVPENGMQVVCDGYIDVYERNGCYQLYIETMRTVGVGDDMQALEQLKKRLLAEGLFDDSHKKPLPKYPRKIGIVTSGTGAAVADLKSNIARRWGLSELVISPTLVQGDKAPADIVRSIALLDSIPEVDIIIVGRGGGANDDLKAFNTEAVARAVYLCQTPVISAVGHEVDNTLCDAVADCRVPTPSTAAEQAVPDKNEELRAVDETYSAILSSVKMKLEREEHRLEKLSILSDREAFFERQERRIIDSNGRVRQLFSNQLSAYDATLKSTAAKLDALSPLSVLGRGYAIARKNGGVVHSVAQIEKGDSLEIRLSDGTLTAEINEVIKDE